MPDGAPLSLLVIAEGALLRLDGGRVVLDVVKFEKAIRSRDLALFGQALTLYNGDIPERFRFDESPSDGGTFFVVASVANDFDTASRWLIERWRSIRFLANAWYPSGWVRGVQNGEPEMALEHFSRLNPFDPIWGCHLGGWLAHFMAGRDDRALSSVEHCLGACSTTGHRFLLSRQGAHFLEQRIEQP
jgi:hypothetical protein